MTTEHQHCGITDSDSDEELRDTTAKKAPPTLSAVEVVTVDTTAVTKPVAQPPLALQHEDAELRASAVVAKALVACLNQQRPKPPAKSRKSRSPPAFVTCDACGQNFYSKRTLQLHVREAHEQKRQQHDSCYGKGTADSVSSSDTKSVADVDVARDVIAPPSTGSAKTKKFRNVVSYVSCAICKANFYTSTTLRHHMKSVHSDAVKPGKGTCNELQHQVKEFSCTSLSRSQNAKPLMQQSHNSG